MKWIKRLPGSKVKVERIDRWVFDHVVLDRIGKFLWRISHRGGGYSFRVVGPFFRAKSWAIEENNRIEEGMRQAEKERRARRAVHRQGSHKGPFKDCPDCKKYRPFIRGTE